MDDLEGEKDAAERWADVYANLRRWDTTTDLKPDSGESDRAHHAACWNSADQEIGFLEYSYGFGK